ncbi:MAG: hypothetical protein J6W71_01025 [Methanobrevibacter sp.]|nr:hypothetical protein [Methanobrevibacter sp.]
MIIDNIKNLLFGIIVVLLLLTVCITVDYAANDTIIATSNQTLDRNINSSVIVLNGSYYSEEKVGVAKLQKVVTEKPKVPLITIVSKPSCGCRNKYVWHKRTFVNYCPYCGKYGVLTNLHKYPSRFEQEISCRKCSSDWCGVCGKEKYSWSKRYLRRA